MKVASRRRSARYSFGCVTRSGSQHLTSMLSRLNCKSASPASRKYGPQKEITGPLLAGSGPSLNSH